MSRQEVADACNVIIDDLCRQRGVRSPWAGMTQRTIGVLESGTQTWTNDLYREALRILFNKTDAELGLHISRPQPSLAGLAPAMSTGGEHQAADVSSAYWTDPGSCREFGLGVTPDADVQRHVVALLDDVRSLSDELVVAALRQRLDHAKADDGLFGPATVLPVVQAILAAITRRAREAKPDLRRSLLSLAADGAEFAGWLCRDLLDLAQAVFWYDRAMEWAQEVDDTPMQAYVLVKKSQMAYDVRDLGRVVTFANAAGRRSWRLPSRVRAEVAQQVALGMAVAGEPLSAIEQTMDHSRELLVTASGEDAYGGPAGATFNVETLLLRQAACYTVAGKPSKAAMLFDEVIGKGGLSQRDTGFFQARRAAALALSGEPDEAATLGIGALQFADQTNSARTRRVLADVVRSLAPWHSRPTPRAFRDAMAAPPSSQSTR